MQEDPPDPSDPSDAEAWTRFKASAGDEYAKFRNWICPAADANCKVRKHKSRVADLKSYLEKERLGDPYNFAYTECKGEYISRFNSAISQKERKIKTLRDELEATTDDINRRMSLLQDELTQLVAEREVLLNPDTPDIEECLRQGETSRRKWQAFLKYRENQIIYWEGRLAELLPPTPPPKPDTMWKKAPPPTPRPSKSRSRSYRDATAGGGGTPGPSRWSGVDRREHGEWVSNYEELRKLFADVSQAVAGQVQGESIDVDEIKKKAARAERLQREVGLKTEWGQNHYRLYARDQAGRYGAGKISTAGTQV